MKLLLQRDISDMNSRYRVFGDRGEPRFVVTGKRTTSGESMRICDTDGNVVCRIRGLGFSALSVFSIRVGGESIRLNIAVTPGRAAVRFRGISFLVRGDVPSGSYSFLDADTSVVCEVGRDFAKGQTCIEVFGDERAMFCLAAVVCIESLSIGQVPALQMT